MLRQLVDLALVEMGDRLHVGEAVASLHEEPLVVFQAVRRAQDGEVEPVGVIVLEHLPDALLEVRGCHDLAKLARREAHLPDVAAGRLYGDIADVQPLGVEPASLQHQFAAPSFPIFGHEPPDRCIASRVAAARVEHPRDLLHNELDPELGGPLARQREAFSVRLALRQAQAQHAPGTHGRRREGGADRAVHAAAHRDDDAGAPQHLADLPPQRAHDLPRDLIQVEPQPLRNGFGHSTSSREKNSEPLTLPGRGNAKFEPRGPLPSPPIGLAAAHGARVAPTTWRDAAPGIVASAQRRAARAPGRMRIESVHGSTVAGMLVAELRHAHPSARRMVTVGRGRVA